MENLYPRLQNQGWGNGEFLLPRGFIHACLDLEAGDGGLAVPCYSVQDCSLDF